ncbi:MAG TPA: helix-turn-helix domain-containing protein [Acidimicrobiales bacterium]|nr:helix-turn-helix domain-containing protein [Acidimicrobiales bacterium]
MTDLQAQARALGDPTRHRIFRHVAGSAVPVGVAELTAYLGIHHNAVRQHLGKLRDAGLLTEELEARDRPGRRRLVYRVASDLDERWVGGGPYQRLAELLLEVVRTGRSAREVGREAGRREVVGGGAAPDALGRLEAVARRQGFQPVVRRRGGRTELVLEHCPLADVAVRDPATVCELHLGLLEGWAEASADDGDAVAVAGLAVRPPHQAGCRVHLAPLAPT